MCAWNIPHSVSKTQNRLAMIVKEMNAFSPPPFTLQYLYRTLDKNLGDSTEMRTDSGPSGATSY